MQKKLLIYILLQICNFLMCSALSVVTPFFPPSALEKGVSEEIVGLIISSNPIGAFFASLYLGKILSETNRFFYMILGLILQSIGMAVFASTYFIDGYALLISVGITARMLSGMGAACFVTSFYAYIPILYPNAIEKMIGISELTAGIGFLIGPIAGSFLYNLGGYLTPFLVFGGMTIVITPIIYGFIRTFTRTKVDDFETTKLPIKNHNIEEVPALLEKLNVEAGNSDNRQPRTAETQNIDERKAHYPQIQSDFQLIDESQNSLFKSSIKQTFGSKEPSRIQPPTVEQPKLEMPLPKEQSRSKSKYEERLSLPLSVSDRMRNRTSLENVMLSRFSHEPIRLGYLQVLSKYTIMMTFFANIVVNFVIMYFAPTLASFLEGEYGANPENVGVLMSVYALTYTVSSFGVTFIRRFKRIWIFVALVTIAIGFVFMGPDFVLKQHSLTIVLAAQGVIGIGVAIGFILSLPTLNDLILCYYPNLQVESANIASALFNASMSIGELLGPIAAGFLTKYLGFEKGCFVTACIITGFALLYVPVVMDKLQTDRFSQRFSQRLSHSNDKHN